MIVLETPLIDASVITVDKYEDGRGCLMESFNEQQFVKELGDYDFVQDNHSKSSKGVLRGLHYQLDKPLLSEKDGIGETFKECEKYD